MRKPFRIALIWIAVILFIGSSPAFAAKIVVVEAVPLQYDSVGYEISEGYVGVGIDEDSETKWGFADRTGEVISPKYDYVSKFCDGMAQVSVGNWTSDWPFRHFYGKHGYINNKGEEVIPLQYDGGFDFYEGIAIVQKYGKFSAIDSTGKELFSLAQYDSVDGFYDGLAKVEQNGKWGFIDKEGREVIPPTFEYEYVRNFINGFAQVGAGTWEDGYTYSYINKDGKEIVPIGKYNDVAWQFSDGLAWVHTGGQYVRGCVNGGKYGFIDSMGNEVIPLKYDKVTNFSDGIALVRQEGNWSIIDTTGKELVSLGDKYNYVSEFSEGLAHVAGTYNGFSGYIDRTGKEVIALQDEVGGSDFHEGLAAVWTNGKYGYIDKDGDMVVPFQYDFALDFHDGMARVMLDGKYGFLAIADPAVTALATPQVIWIDNKAIEFNTYALKDENDNLTNYVKLRDVASVLNGTGAQFEVSWDGKVNILSGQAYTPNGSEMTTPFSGDRTYTPATAPTKVNGSEIAIDAIVLTDDQGGAYTYYKLRDLGEALGFTVDWSAQQGVFIETR